MTAHIEPRYLWVFFKSYEESGNVSARKDLARQVDAILPSLPLRGAIDLLAEAPKKALTKLWERWVEGADLSGFSLSYMDKQTRGMSPAILVMIFTAWCHHADLSHYVYEDFSKIARKWPRKANVQISREVFEKWPHLKVPMGMTPKLEDKT